MSLDHFKSLLEELGKTIGLPDLKPDEELHCCLGVDEKIILHIQYNDEFNQMTLFSQLGYVPEEYQLKAYALFLHANVFWKGTGGATIGVDKDSGVVSMGFIVPLFRMEYEQFQRLLENFIKNTEKWIVRVEEIAMGKLDEEAAEKAAEKAVENTEVPVSSVPDEATQDFNGTESPVGGFRV